MDAEAPPPPDPDGNLTRRGFLGRTATVAGGMTLLGGSVAHASRFLDATVIADAAAGAGALTAAELATLAAVLAQLMPGDYLGPGAVEAGVPTYIDRALAGSYNLLPVYRGLLPLFDKAAASKGVDRPLRRCRRASRSPCSARSRPARRPARPASEAASAAADFQLLLAHMREGMFADPMYGGNRQLAGWKLLGYPGIQLKPTAADQRIGTVVASTGQTATTLGGKPYDGPYADA